MHHKLRDSTEGEACSQYPLMPRVSFHFHFHYMDVVQRVTGTLDTNRVRCLRTFCINAQYTVQLDGIIDILMGTHKEGGAVTFWSHAVSLPLSSNAILTWKFCYMVHKLLRDGHSNVIYVGRRNICVCMCVIPQGNLHDRYGHIVALYSKFLCHKIEFHKKVKQIPPNLEVPDTVLDRIISVDINKVFETTLEVFDYMDAALKLEETVFGQMDSNNVSSATSVGQCRLAPLVFVIQDCGPLYHLLVKLLFKLHSRIPADALLEHREKFREHFNGLTVFFDRARQIEYFKTIIQIPDLPESPPNFLRGAALAEHVKPVVVENKLFEDEDLEQTDIPGMVYPMVQWHHWHVVSILHGWPSAQLCVMQLRSQVNQLEAELEDQRTHKQIALVENERLRMEMDALRAHTAMNASMHTTAEEADSECLTAAAQMTQCTCLCWTLLHVCVLQADDHLSSLLVGLQEEKDLLLRTVREQEAEIARLRQAAQMHQATLQQERDRSQRELAVLQNQLQDKVHLQQRLQDEQFSLLQCAVVEAEGIVLDAVAKLDDPLHVRCTSSPDYLINRAETTLGSIDKMQQSHTGYLRNLDDASGLLRAVTQFSHLAADTIVNGAATSHSAPVDQADRLTENCRDCATHCLQFLKELKFKATLPRADPTAIRYVIQRILHLGQDLRPRGLDVQKEELGDMVDKEMAATSSAIEEAVLRMDEILNQARRDTSGIKLEVNQRVSNGAASVKEFYAKNSCWTEGLISAAKSVGWGATELLNSADKVVSNNGKFEELIVCSHEIAASTAQLVAASKVKADRNNRKLHTLQQASRHVNDMAAVVVTSTKAGQMQFEDKDPMDFSGLSLIKLKKEEMETQVRVLELESCLEKERVHLGELRKKHYELRGATDQPAGTEDEDLANYPPPPPVLLSPEPPTNPFLASRPSNPFSSEPVRQEAQKTAPTKKSSIFHRSGTLLKSAVGLFSAFAYVLTFTHCVCFLQ
uniref:I/LWEQ domain-containing protein n=1 Tax=Denticeps clupeoides TaxID=299321 RepID=A0AAY4CME8_9TELE